MTEQKLLRASHVAWLQAYLPLPIDLIDIIESFKPIEHVFDGVYVKCIICGTIHVNIDFQWSVYLYGSLFDGMAGLRYST
jgi:hypothetical protein